MRCIMPRFLFATVASAGLAISLSLLVPTAGIAQGPECNVCAQCGEDGLCRQTMGGVGNIWVSADQPTCDCSATECGDLGELCEPEFAALWEALEQLDSPTRPAGATLSTFVVENQSQLEFVPARRVLIVLSPCDGSPIGMLPVPRDAQPLVEASVRRIS